MTELPPPGWYDDPTSPAQERWWDGVRWSEQTRRKAVEEFRNEPGELRDVGDFLSHAFGMIRKRWDDFLLVTIIGALPVALLAVALVRPIVDGLTFNEREVIGFGATQAGQLVAFFLLSSVIGLALSISQYRIAWSAATDEQIGWATALQYGVANLFRFLGWIIAIVVPLIAGVILVAVLVMQLGGIGVLIFFAFMAFALWFGITVSFVPIALVAKPGTNPISNSFATVKGRWWRIFGRLLVMGLITGIVVQLVSAILGSFVGSTFFGLEFAVDDQGNIEFTKNLGNSLEFFLGSFVLVFMSFVGNVASFCGVTSIAYDAMPGAVDEAPSAFGV